MHWRPLNCMHVLGLAWNNLTNVTKQAVYFGQDWIPSWVIYPTLFNFRKKYYIQVSELNTSKRLIPWAQNILPFFSYNAYPLNTCWPGTVELLVRDSESSQGKRSLPFATHIPTNLQPHLSWIMSCKDTSAGILDLQRTYSRLQVGVNMRMNKRPKDVLLIHWLMTSVTQRLHKVTYWVSIVLRISMDFRLTLIF